MQGRLDYPDKQKCPHLQQNFKKGVRGIKTDRWRLTMLRMHRIQRAAKGKRNRRSRDRDLK